MTCANSIKQVSQAILFMVKYLQVWLTSFHQILVKYYRDWTYPHLNSSEMIKKALDGYRVYLQV